MSRPSPDYLLASLIHGFLDTDASRAAGIPAETAVALRLMDDGLPVTLPCLLVSGIEDKDSKTAAKRVINVSVMLFYRLKNQASDAALDPESLKQVVTREQASIWMDAVESRLRNLPAFLAYVAAQPEALREGWQLMAWRPEASVEIKRDKEEMGQTLLTNVRIYLAWSRGV